MEALPDSTQLADHATSTRSSSRIGRKSQCEVVSEENGSTLDDFADYTESSMKRKRTVSCAS